MKTIGLACDHAGFELKEYVRGWLEAKGWAYKDFGTNSTASVDYPDYAHPLALAVESGECYPRYRYLRQWKRNQYDAEQAPRGSCRSLLECRKSHTWLVSTMTLMYWLCRGRFISTEEADMILTEFFSTKF